MDEHRMLLIKELEADINSISAMKFIMKSDTGKDAIRSLLIVLQDEHNDELHKYYEMKHETLEEWKKANLNNVD